MDLHVLQDFTLYHLSGTDFGAFVLALLALQFGVLAWRDREQGMGWISASFGLLGLMLWVSNHTLPVKGVSNPSSVVLTFSVLCFLTRGLLGYLEIPPALHARLLLATTGPTLLLFLAHAAGLPPERPMFLGATAWHLTGTVLMLWWGSRREPGAGHALVGVALLSIPACAVLSILAGPSVVIVRYMMPVPAVLFGLTLLTVSLRRRRMALEAEVERRNAAEAELVRANELLEQRVAQRTVELREMIDALESFNRNVSHDLRMPLVGVAAAARASHLALSRGDPDPALRLLPRIEAEAAQSERLVNALLAMARVSDATLRPTALDPAAIAHEVSRRLVDQVEADGPRPQFQIEPMPRVRADPDLVHAVLQNLLGNAVKFTRGQQQPLVRVDGQVQDDRLVVAVRDNGVGFEPSAAETLFQPFMRLHERQVDGHGVGLSIVRRAVERHGGRVWAHSTPGVGASFFFSLPLAGT